MRRVLQKGMAIALAAAMVITAAPATEAGAAKKPSMAKKASVVVGKTTTIKIKNSNKKAKVTWKTSKKSVAKITKQVKKGAKASATVKGVKAGKAKITATYKVGKKTTKFTCTVTVKKASPATQAPVVTATPTKGAATQAPTATSVPTAKPTKGPTNTPRPTNTPSPFPKNESLSATKLGDSDAITVDGTIGKVEWENVEGAQDLLVNPKSIRGEATIKAASAQIAWTDNAVYFAVTADQAMDEVKVFVDEDGDDTNKNAKSATATLCSDDKKCAEAKIDLSKAPDVEKGLKVEIQIKNGNATINYFDSVTKIAYDKDNDKWDPVDDGIKAGTDDSVLGTLNLNPSMAQATNAYFTDKKDEIITASGILTAAWENEPAEGEELPAVKTKKMNFVDTKYWTDAYTANGSGAIFFPNVNIPSYMANAEKVELAEKNEDGTFKKDENDNFISSRDLAKAYIIWDKEYLYVLFDVKDTDVSPEDVENPYISDSTEFFLDEDNSKPAAYATDGTGDEVQLRIGAIDNFFSSNETQTGCYSLVGHASKVLKEGENTIGYQTEYIIKLNNEHKSGDIMGMDLQINDCYTESTIPEATEDNPSPEPVVSSSRAATVTAYDTTNNCYQYPNCFGRVKLINKDEAPSDNPGGDNPGGTTELKYTATKTDATITVDGTEDDAYAAAVAMPFESRILTVAEEKDTNASEVSATAKMLWDANNLYGYVKVKDANISAGAGNAHERDGLEFFLDEDNCKVLNETDKNDWISEDAFQYRMTGFTKDESSAALAALTNEIAGAKDKTLYKDNIETAYVFTEDGYAVEFKIAFKEAKAVDAVMGFDLIVQDCAVIDGVDKREAELYLVETEAGKSYWNNKAAFGEIKLVEAKSNTVSIDLSTLFANEKMKKTNNADGSVTLEYDAAKKAEWGFSIPADIYKNFNTAKVLVSYKDGSVPSMNYTEHLGFNTVPWDSREISHWGGPALQGESGVAEFAISTDKVAEQGNLGAIRFFDGTEGKVTITAITLVAAE